MRAGKFAALAGLALSCLSPQLVYALDAVAVEGGSGDDGINRYGMPCNGIGGCNGCGSRTGISEGTGS